MPHEDVERSPADIAREIASLREHLHDVPPHSASGVRDAVQRRIAALEAELASTRRSR